MNEQILTNHFSGWAIRPLLNLVVRLSVLNIEEKIMLNLHFYFI